MHSSLTRTPQRHLDPHLSNAIRQAKIDSGMSFRELGVAVGRSHAFLVQIANGQKVPGTLTAQRLIEALWLDDEIAAELLEVAAPPWWERKNGGSHELHREPMGTRGVSALDRP